MQVAIERYKDSDRGRLVVIREAGEQKYSKTAAGESRLMYRIKQELQNQGHDVIKKRMGRDGHLVDELQQYIRTSNRRIKHPDAFYVWDDQYALRFCTEDFNAGRLELAMMFGVYEQNTVVVSGRGE